MRFSGRVWMLVDGEGRLIDDIDTDQIFHNSHLAITDIEKMGQHAFGNLDGYEDFASKAQEGDILIAGENFGAGSSRQQAVDCFKALGVVAIIARSYGAIYKRNAINSGFPILTIMEIEADSLRTGDQIEVDPGERTIRKEGATLGRIQEMSKVQNDILDAGNIFLYARRMGD